MIIKVVIFTLSIEPKVLFKNNAYTPVWKSNALIILDINILILRLRCYD